MAESRSEAKKSESRAKLTAGKWQPRRRPPPNYFSRKEQYRLLILCATLMLVLVMMNEARKPHHWRWLWAGTETGLETTPEQPINTKVDGNSTKLPPDGFTITDNTGSKSPSASVESDKRFLPGISAELLAPIQDNTVMRAAENEAWLAMLGILNSRDEFDLHSQSIGLVSFSQLYRQTDFYRGKLVTVRGTVHRVEDIQPRENEHGIERLYRWIIEPAGGSNSPIVIYSIEKPPGFPSGDDLREEAAFTGFCFKRWAYAAGDGTRIAPLLLAKTSRWQPPTPVEPVRLPAAPITMAVLAGLVGLSAIIALAVYRTSVAKRPEITRLRAQLAGDVNQINDDDVLPTVGVALRDLAESKQPDEASS